MIWMAMMSVCMRAVPIFSVITLLGGIVFARATKAPLERFAPYLQWSSILIILSGVYNLVTKQNIPPRYHIWFGLKMLLALHVLGVSFVLAKASVGEEKKMRLMSGVIITGVLIVVLSAYLRFLANWMMI